MTTTAPAIPNYVTGTWVIDPAHSNVGFIVKHAMVSKVRGRFTSFDAQITTADNIVDSTVSATIDLTTISTDNDMRDNHIRSADFFDVENHPTMTFTSTGIRVEDGEFLIDGDLTIRGTTKPVTLTVDEPAIGPGLDGTTTLGLSASTDINRTDFGVSYNGPIPGGGVVVSEKVQIVLDVEARLQ